MTFLLNKKTKKNGGFSQRRVGTGAEPRRGAMFFFALFFLIAGGFWLLSSGVAARVSAAVAAPFWRAGESAMAGAGESVSAFFSSKQSLSQENEDLRARVQGLEKNLLGFDLALQENLDLKKAMGRSGEKKLLLAGVLADPRGLPYDIFSIDAGNAQGVREGDMVLAGFGDKKSEESLSASTTPADLPAASLPVVAGKVREVFGRTARVRSFSSAGEETPVFLGPDNIATILTGAGGGTFTAMIPKEADIQKGDMAVLPGVEGYFAAVVEKTETDASGAFQKIYLRAPFNPAQLRYVALPLHPEER